MSHKIAGALHQNRTFSVTWVVSMKIRVLVGKINNIALHQSVESPVVTIICRGKKSLKKPERELSKSCP